MPFEWPCSVRTCADGGWEVGAFFGDVTADSPDDVLRRAATRHPVFRIVPGTDE